MLLIRSLVISTLLLIGVSFLYSDEAKAEPGSTQNWLMRTPVDLWTYGMDQLRRQVSEMREEGILLSEEQIFVEPHTGAFYDWDMNRIEIWAQFLGSRNYSKDFCEKVVEALRESGGVIDGKLSEPFDQSLYSQNFLRAFSDGTEPENYTSTIDETIEITVRFSDGECRGSLLSTETFHKTD